MTGHMIFVCGKNDATRNGPSNLQVLEVSTQGTFENDVDSSSGTRFVYQYNYTYDMPFVCVLRTKSVTCGG